MKDTNVGFVKEVETQELFRHIFDNAQGTLIELDAAPTADVPLLTENQIGIYSNSIYWRVSDTIYIFASDSQIAITTNEA